MARGRRRGQAPPDPQGGRGMRRALVVATAVLLAMAVLGQGARPSGADFTAGSAHAKTTFGTATLFNSVAVSVTNPGTPLRGTVAVNATATSDEAMASVRIQRSPAGAGTWTDLCTDTVAAYSCSWTTTGVADGLYDLRAIAVDALGYTQTSAIVAEPPRRQHRARHDADRPGHAADRHQGPRRDGHRRRQRRRRRRARVPHLPLRRLDDDLHRHHQRVRLLVEHHRGRRRPLRPALHRDRQRRQHRDLDRLQPPRRQHGAEPSRSSRTARRAAATRRSPRPSTTATAPASPRC